MRKVFNFDGLAKFRKGKVRLRKVECVGLVKG